jgi:leucyl aminopeptidase (aminopeptidase T)
MEKWPMGALVTDQSRLARAAQNILTRSFNLRRDQNLLVFTDINSLEVVDVIARNARELGIATTALFVPRVLQSELGPADTLPLPSEAAVREADAILSCLSDQPEHLHYRMRVLHTSWSRRARLAHAPGMNLDVLRMMDTDYAAIAEQAQLVALTLILGKRMEIVTTDAARREHRLNVQVAGWNYPPGINDGVIRDGAWSNLPPGEVYIVPGDADGRIVINGAVPGRVLGLNDELLLTFREGRLVDMQPEDSPAARHIQDTQFNWAERRGDTNWSNLAEVGFGLNPSVQDLTGHPVVDEKKAHTIHVGLGHSASLGGDVESLIHCDMIARKPTVYINGRLIMKKGDWRINESDWRLDHRNVSPPAGWWERLDQIGRSGVRTERENGRLVCVWNAGRGRWDSAAIGLEQTARLAARIFEFLPENGAFVPKARVLAAAEQSGLPVVALPGLFWVMNQFDLLRLPIEKETGSPVVRPAKASLQRDV